MELLFGTRAFQNHSRLKSVLNHGKTDSYDVRSFGGSEYGDDAGFALVLSAGALAVAAAGDCVANLPWRSTCSPWDLSGCGCARRVTSYCFLAVLDCV